MSKIAVIISFIAFCVFIHYIGFSEARDLRDVECDCRCDENGEAIGGTDCEKLINDGEDEESESSSQNSTDLIVPEGDNSEKEVLKRDKRYYGGCGCCGCCMMMGTPKTVTKTIKVTYGGCCGCGYGYG